MRRWWRISMSGGRLLATAAVATLLSCSGGSNAPSEPNNPGQPNNPGGSGAVAVVNNRFDPSTLDVPLNSTVTWQWNSGGVEHNVTFQDGPASATQGSGSFARTFPNAGSFPYVCTIHAAEGMTGVVNVAGGTGGGGGSGGGGGGYP